MSIHLVPTLTLHPVPGTAQIRPFTVAEYHRLAATGIFDGERLELLDGYLFRKGTVNPPHALSLVRVVKALQALLPATWELRNQLPITLATSEPLPDAAVARGPDHTYANRHPAPHELAFVVEVADSTLDTDRNIKGPLYSAAGIPIYWIVNVVQRQVEVYTLAAGSYGPPTVLLPGQLLPVVIAGVHHGDIAVADLFV